MGSRIIPIFNLYSHEAELSLLKGEHFSSQNIVELFNIARKYLEKGVLYSQVIEPLLKRKSDFNIVLRFDINFLQTSVLVENGDNGVILGLKEETRQVIPLYNYASGIQTREIKSDVKPFFERLKDPLFDYRESELEEKLMKEIERSAAYLIYAVAFEQKYNGISGLEIINSEELHNRIGDDSRGGIKLLPHGGFDWFIYAKAHKIGNIPTGPYLPEPEAPAVMASPNETLMQCDLEVRLTGT